MRALLGGMMATNVRRELRPAGTPLPRWLEKLHTWIKAGMVKRNGIIED